MGDAGTPRGLSRTEDGGPSTQRGEPLGDEGDSLLAGGFGHAVPQAPEVLILIGSETGSAAELLISAVDAVVACVHARSPQRSALSH